MVEEDICMRRSPLTASRKTQRFKLPPAKPEVVVKKKDAILVLRAIGGIGDMLMLTPAIRGIKEQYPFLPMVVCTTNKYPPVGCLFDLLKNNPFIDEVISVNELGNYRFYKTYNFQTNEEAGIEVNPAAKSSNRIDIFCDLAKVNPSSKLPIYNVTEEEKVWADKWVERIPKERQGMLFGVHASSAYTRRAWPREKVLLLAFLLTNNYPNSSVIFFEDVQYETNELKYPNIYHVKGMPIRWVAALMDRCYLMVATDSGLLHIAGALKKRIVGLFGSTPPEARLDKYAQSFSITMDYPCSPCWYQKCGWNFKCLTDITVEMVQDAIEKVINQDTPAIGKEARKGLCVVRMGGVGDLILLSSSLRKLAEENPNTDVVLATNPDHLNLFKGVPYLKDVITIPQLHKLYFDRTIDLRWQVESPEVGGTLDSEVYKTKPRSDVFDKLLGVKSDKKFDISINSEKVERMKEVIGWDKAYKWVGIQTTCTSNLRTLPPEYIPGYIEQLQGEGRRTVLFGRSEFWYGRQPRIKLNSIEGENIVNLMDKTDLEEMLALCSLMDYIIAPDSSAVHIAGALGIKCLALFGNLDPVTRTSYYPSVVSLFPKGELPCIPCHDFKNPCLYYESIDTVRQPVGGKCMRLFTPERVFEAFQKLMKGE